MLFKGMLFKGRNFAALAVGAGIVAAGLGSGQAGATAEPLRCEIRATKASGMITLAGIVHADSRIDGSYSFRVAGGGSGGRTDISQGGEFTAGPGQAETLGQVMLGGSGAVFDASLDVTAGGRTWRCSERVG